MYASGLYRLPKPCEHADNVHLDLDRQGRHGITTENFDQKIHESTKLAIKFRQPLAVKSHFFKATATVTSVAKATEEGGVEEATIQINYISMDSADRAILDSYVDDLDEFRGEAH